MHELSEKLGVDFKDISGNFRKVMLGLMVPTSDYDAYCAMKALDESESDFIEIVASRTNEEMREMSIAFKKRKLLCIDINKLCHLFFLPWNSFCI